MDLRVLTSWPENRGQIVKVDPASLQASVNMAEGARGRYVVKAAIQIEGGKNPIWDQS